MWGTISTIKSHKSIPAHELGRCGCQPNHTGIKILDDFVIFIKNRTMNFIKDNQIKETRSKFFKTVTQGLQGGRVKPVRFLDVITINTGTRFIGEEFFKAIRFSLGPTNSSRSATKRIFCAWLADRKTLISDIAVLVFPVPVAITSKALRLPLANVSHTLRMASC